MNAENSRAFAATGLVRTRLDRLIADVMQVSRWPTTETVLVNNTTELILNAIFSSLRDYFWPEGNIDEIVEITCKFFLHVEIVLFSFIWWSYIYELLFEWQMLTSVTLLLASAWMADVATSLAAFSASVSKDIDTMLIVWNVMVSRNMAIKWMHFYL